MDFALQLISFMVDFIEERIQEIYDLDERQLLELFNAPDGHIMDDYEFFVKYKSFMDNSCVDGLRSFIVTGSNIASKRINKIECFMDSDYVFESEWNFALSFMAIYVMIHDCCSKDKKRMFNYFNKKSIIEYKRDFLENDEFANEIIRKFLLSFTNIQQIEKNTVKIEENEKYKQVFDKWNFYSSHRVCTINSVLREVLEQLYFYYLDEGIARIKITELIRKYFTDNVDPIGTLKEYGFNEESINEYNKILISIVVADLYEDALNYNYDKELFALGDINAVTQEMQLVTSSKSQADFYLSLSTIGNLYEYVTNNPQLFDILMYNYFDILDNPERIITNRKNTRQNGCIKKLARINPLYNLDDIHLN